jgi:hypothetical protein
VALWLHFVRLSVSIIIGIRVSCVAANQGPHVLFCILPTGVNCVLFCRYCFATENASCSCPSAAGAGGDALSASAPDASAGNDASGELGAIGPEPLLGHPRYRKVRDLNAGARMTKHNFGHGSRASGRDALLQVGMQRSRGAVGRQPGTQRA